MKALLVIDIQNDYFPGGRFPLEGADEALKHALIAIQDAKEAGAKIVAIQHLMPAGGPFFEEGTTGADFHPSIAAAVQGDSVVIKREADSFFNTELSSLLKTAGVDQIDIVGMMTQHCVTHTALSPEAADFDVTILGEACAAPTKALSALALIGLKARFEVK